MKLVKYIQSLVLLLLVGMTAQAQDINELSVKDVNGMRNKIVSVPVYLTNTLELSAVQFDITMPSGSQVYIDSTQVADNRRVDHVISGYNKGSYRYRFMFYSPTNQALLGNTGKLCNIVFKVSNSLDDTKTYDIKLSNIVMSDTKGNPVETSSVDGHLTLQSYPDFEVSNFQVTKANMVPGGRMTLDGEEHRRDCLHRRLEGELLPDQRRRHAGGNWFKQFRQFGHRSWCQHPAQHRSDAALGAWYRWQRESQSRHQGKQRFRRTLRTGMEQ